MSPRRVTGIVLAGGASTRFAAPGGRSKLDADLAGRTVLDRSIDAVAACCDEVLVAGRPSGPRPGARYLADATAFEGPLAGLLVGLAAAVHPIAVVIGGDAPLTRQAVLALLAESLADPSVDAAVLGDGDRWRPLPLALRVAVARPVIQAAFDRGERSIRRALAQLRLHVDAEPVWRAVDPEGDSLLDIDNPKDLVEAGRRLGPP